jgi:hypothetical protein
MGYNMLTMSTLTVKLTKTARFGLEKHDLTLKAAK